MASGCQRWQAEIRDGLAAMHRHGELAADPDALALALLIALQGGLLMAQIQRRVRPLEVAIDVMLERTESLTKDGSP